MSYKASNVTGHFVHQAAKRFMWPASMTRYCKAQYYSQPLASPFCLDLWLHRIHMRVLLASRNSSSRTRHRSDSESQRQEASRVDKPHNPYKTIDACVWNSKVSCIVSWILDLTAKLWWRFLVNCEWENFLRQVGWDNGLDSWYYIVVHLTLRWLGPWERSHNGFYSSIAITSIEYNDTYFRLFCVLFCGNFRQISVSCVKSHSGTYAYLECVFHSQFYGMPKPLFFLTCNNPPEGWV